MEFRHHPGDAYPFDPRLLKIDAGYNVRNLDDPSERDELDELKEQIRANGVRTPLEVRLAGDDVIIVAGHRRHKVVMELIEEGEDIKAVPVLPEPKGTGEADRIVNLVISNSGKPLKPLEIAEVVRRLVAFGWEKQQIAQRLGWKSASSINQYLDMLAMPEGVKEHVRKGEVSATLARKIVKDSGPEETAEDRIRANLEENRRIRGKLKKVTPKSLKRDAEKKKAEQRKLSPDIFVSGGTASETVRSPSAASTLPAEQQPAAGSELPPAPVPQQDTNSEPVELATGTQDRPDASASPAAPSGDGREALQRPTDYESAGDDAALHQSTLAKVEEHNGWHPDKAPEGQVPQADDNENARSAALVSDCDLPENVRVLLDDLDHPERDTPDLRARAAEMIRCLAVHVGALDVMAEVGFAGTMRKGEQIQFLVQAVEPFAAAVELNDLGERSDDDVIEIPIRDLKRAWRAYTQATGGQS